MAKLQSQYILPLLSEKIYIRNNAQLEADRIRKVPEIKNFHTHFLSTFEIKHTASTWLDRSGLMSVIRNLFRLIRNVATYLRLFVETYQQIL